MNIFPLLNPFCLWMKIQSLELTLVFLEARICFTWGSARIFEAVVHLLHPLLLCLQHWFTPPPACGSFTVLAFRQILLFPGGLSATVGAPGCLLRRGTQKSRENTRLLCSSHRRLSWASLSLKINPLPYLQISKFYCWGQVGYRELYITYFCLCIVSMYYVFVPKL